MWTNRKFATSNSRQEPESLHLYHCLQWRYAHVNSRYLQLDLKIYCWHQDNFWLNHLQIICRYWSGFSECSSLSVGSGIQHTRYCSGHTKACGQNSRKQMKSSKQSFPHYGDNISVLPEMHILSSCHQASLCILCWPNYFLWATHICSSCCCSWPAQ